MPWPASENFESYSDGAALDGQNGGAGWSGAWAKSGAIVAIDAVSSPTLSGTRAARLYTGSTSSCGLERPVANTSSGALSFTMRMDTRTIGYGLFTLLGTGGVDAAQLALTANSSNYGGTPGNIVMTDGVNKFDIMEWSADTNYTVIWQYDCGASQHRVSIDGGAFTAWKAFNASAANIIGFKCSNNAGTAPGGTRQVYFDVVAPYTVVDDAPEFLRPSSPWAGPWSPSFKMMPY